MELRHYAAEPVTLTPDYQHSQWALTRTDKPAGLWVSVPGEDDWPSWCRAEDFGIDRLAVEHVVVLTADARILHLSSCAAIDEFTAEYGINNLTFGPHGIDWARVSESYQGIVIAPYQWERRSSMAGAPWYWGWDCASGCIWDMAAIESLTVVRQEAAA